MSDVKYGSGLLTTIVINGTTYANQEVYELPDMTAPTFTVQCADGPQVIPDIVTSYGKIVATVPFAASANLLASSGAVPTAVPTHITISGTIPTNPSGQQNFTGTGYIAGDKGGTVKRGQNLQRIITVDLDSFLTWS